MPGVVFSFRTRLGRYFMELFTCPDSLLNGNRNQTDNGKHLSAYRFNYHEKSKQSCRISSTAQHSTAQYCNYFLFYFRNSGSAGGVHCSTGIRSLLLEAPKLAE